MSSAPYSIEIVPADRGWILEAIARVIEHEAALSPGRFKVRVADEPSDNVDLTFFLPESAYRPLRNSITVTHMAHKEEDKAAAALFEEVARSCDCCITPSKKYERVLIEDGAKRVVQIHNGVDTSLFTPMLRLGVVGRTYHTGRKGESLLAEIAGLPMVELRFTGEGWPYPAGYYAQDDLVRFYRDIDYLLIPSLIEGGPVPLLEALSAGCPVIAPSDIGMVEDFPHVPFKRGDAADLRRVVEGLLRQKLALRESVLPCDWQEFARRHLEVFVQLIDERRREAPAREPATVEPAVSPVRVLLVTHGTEDAAKGGPSTRVRFIVASLQAEGHHVETRHNIRSTADLLDFDVVHVFNSWPPHTALESMAIARNAGKAVVFSPIALDLSDWPIHRQLMECAFASGNQASIDDVIRQLPDLAPRRRYSGAMADVPVEGIPGHFEALRRCCALADHVVFLSELERDFLGAIGARIDHGHLIHNGVSRVFADEVGPELFRAWSGFQQYVLCVGRIEYRKNQALLARAMKGLDVPLVLIGDVGDPGYLDHVRRLGGNNLYHYARIDDKALLASAYAGAALFVLPSWSEGAPLAALEAGMAGVPLVLSDRSSEREYFGDLADYASPADPAAMRDAILGALERRETPARRAERAALLRERYSEAEHVHRTLDLYRRATAAERTSANQELVIDVSALLHSLRVGGHLTGVPLAERHLVAELVAMHPIVRCIAYNDVKGRFIEVAYRDLEHFDAEAFNRRYWFSDDESEAGVDHRLELTLAHAPVPPPILPAERPVPPGLWEYWAVRVAGLLSRLGLSPRMVGRIGRLANGLRALVSPPPPSLAGAPVMAVPADVDFAHASRYLARIRVPRPALGLVPGTRVITLGQGWISNEPLLDRLVELAAGHRLEAYVYDIAYVSGAHFSGWGDNEDRQRRLGKLLRHCQTVFTESRLTAAELAKYGASRGLAYRIVRTQLRGKDMAPAKASLLPRRQDPFVLYVSSFNRRKNHDFIVGVWKDLMTANSPLVAKGVRLLLLGEVQGESKYGDPDFRESLRRYNIDVISDADDEQLAGYYNRCLYTVFPSIQEGWGLPVQESLMNGKVCLASNTVPAVDEIDNAALIKLAPHDFFGWREALVTWATNDAMRVAFEAQASRYAPPAWRDIAACILHRTSLPNPRP